MDETTITTVAHAIRQYLSTRQQAADTAEGILRWWIPQCQDFATPLTVWKALEKLEAEGVIERLRYINRTVWRTVQVNPLNDD